MYKRQLISHILSVIKTVHVIVSNAFFCHRIHWIVCIWFVFADCTVVFVSLSCVLRELRLQFRPISLKSSIVVCYNIVKLTYLLT